MPISKVTASSIDGLGYGFKNRIINGAMTISQRGTSFSGYGYTLDRWANSFNSPVAYTITQSTGAPSGYKNSLLFTNTTAGTIGSNLNYIYQVIEGNNIVDLAWGTANASPVTLSFWVKTSVTGTFGGSLRTANNGGYYSYPFTYAVNSANTWEQKTITIDGPTSGTWSTDNGAAIYLFFDLGSSSTYAAPAGSWISGNYIGGNGTQTTLIPTSGATWQITGVQIEKGSVATDFDYRPYGTELALCQRYYWKEPGTIYGCRYGDVYGFVIVNLPNTMRTTPELGYSAVATTTGLTGYPRPSVAAYLMTSTSAYVTGLTADAEL